MKNITLWLSGLLIMFTALCGNAQTSVERKKTVHQQIDEKHLMEETQNFQEKLNITLGKDVGSAPDWNWALQFGGDGNDVGYDLETDANGNIYVVGSFAGSITIGATAYTSSGFRDMFVAKVNSNGTLIWWKQSAVAQYQTCEALGIALDNANNIYITGYFDAQTLTLGTHTLTRIGKEDLFVAKYDNDGNTLWAKNMGFTGLSFRSRKIAVDISGNSYAITTHDVLKFNTGGQLQWNQNYPTAFFYDVASHNYNFYLTGRFNNQVTFGSNTLTGVSYYDFPFIAKGTSTGEYNWAIQAESTRLYNRGDAIAVDANENVYMAGSYRKKLTFGSTIITTSSYDYTPFLAKYNVNGQFQWVQAAVYANSLTNMTQKQTDLCLDAGNYPYIIGTYADGCSFDTVTLTGSGNFLTKYSSAGSLQWVKTQDISMSDTKITFDEKICQTTGSDGNVLIQQSDLNLNQVWSLASTGNSGIAEIQSLETDTPGNIYSLGYSEVATSFTGSATGLFVAKHNSTRDLQWIKTLIGADHVPGYGDPLFLDASGNVYVAGTFSDTLKIEDVTMFAAQGEKNTFLAKFNNAGTLQWARQIRGNTYSQGSIIADHQGNVIVTSTFYNSVTIGNTTFNDWGYDDIFLAKYNPSGDFLWAKHVGGPDTEWASFISLDGSNNIYLSGEFLSRQIDFTGLSLTLNEGDGDVILAKYSPDGIPLWARDYGDGDSTNYERMNCWPTAIETDVNGNSYIYGWTGSQNYFGAFFLESPYSYNFFLTKINPAGQVLWAKIIKEKQYGWQSMQIDIDAAGNCYIGGNFTDTLYFENNMILNQGLCDIFVAKYDQFGVFKWCKTVAGSKNMGANSSLWGIAAYDSNSVFTGGRFTSNYNFDNILLSASGQNGFLSLLGDPINGIKEISPSHLTVSPNPGDGNFYLHIGEKIKLPISIIIYNSLGQMMMNMPIASTESVVKIDLTAYPKGMYVIKVQGHLNNGVEKIILR